jgi:hypothetical protein
MSYGEIKGDAYEIGALLHVWVLYFTRPYILMTLSSFINYSHDLKYSKHEP